jgi:hypothetical protein
VPPRLLEPPPEVAPGLGTYMKAFWDLCGDRPQGGRIPWSSVHAWCAAKGIVGDDEEDAHFLVTRLDIEYLKWSRKKGAGVRPEDRPGGKPQGVRRRP